jgi:hypothetical protein
MRACEGMSAVSDRSSRIGEHTVLRIRAVPAPSAPGQRFARLSAISCSSECNNAYAQVLGTLVPEQNTVTPPWVAGLLLDYEAVSFLGCRVPLQARTKRLSDSLTDAMTLTFSSHRGNL